MNAEPPRAQPRKIRLRGLEWFLLPEEDREVTGGDMVEAWVYLVAVVAAPLLLAFLVWHPIEIHDFLYIAPGVAAASVPAFMTEEVCDVAGRRYLSFFALRVQVWLQLGGAVPAAVRSIRRRARQQAS